MQKNKIYVTNITDHFVREDGYHRIRADFRCRNKQKTQIEVWLTEEKYNKICRKGYFREIAKVYFHD